MKTLTTILTFLIFLPGCLDNRPQQNPTGPSITHDSATTDALNRLSDQGEALQHDLSTSQNAIQQNMQSLVGVSVGKVADDLVHMDTELKDLIHVQVGEIKNSLTASITANNELRLQLKAQIDINQNLQLDIRNSIKIQAELKASLEAQVAAVTAAQAGIGNKLTSQIEEMKQNLSAGHDVNNSTVQFNQQMLGALQSANETTVATNKLYAGILCALITAAALIVGLVLHASRKRADARAEAAHTELKQVLDKKVV